MDLEQPDRRGGQFVNMVQDPVPTGVGPLECRICKKWKLGPRSDDGRAVCQKCRRVHGFIVLGGKVNYGVCL